ncbi:MAG: hypothetical protein O2956_12545 [Gemmatimonadetes bacterium]|nr:hypothetical protein [Gemmatimonadota bacterium]
MAARKGGGPQRPVKGFRPGKEPAHLKKQRAKAQLGKDASWAQKQAVDVIAGRSPQEVRKMVQRWSRGVIAAAVLLAIVGAFLYGWAVAAGITAHVASAGLFFLGYRIGKQGSGLVDMADRM